jgi:hypothetical protein
MIFSAAVLHTAIQTAFKYKWAYDTLINGILNQKICFIANGFEEKDGKKEVQNICQNLFSLSSCINF